MTLPPELWERVFLRLPPVQIVALRAVNRSFRDVIDGSPEAQYSIDLYAAGLEPVYEGPSLTLADRREQLARYRSHWDSLKWVEQKSLSLPRNTGWTLEGGVICFRLSANSSTTDYRFIQLPSVLRRIPLREWTLHGLPNVHHSPGLLPEEDLLVVFSRVENDRRSFTMQLRRMSDGQIHPSALVPIINGPEYGRDESVRSIKIKITSSRLAVAVLASRLLFLRNPGPVFHFIVWDWRTGVKHVDIRRLSLQAQFVDEHRIFTVSDHPDPALALITLIDTSLPTDDPQNPREVEFKLDDVESPHFASLLAGTHVQGAKLGSPFRTNPRGHFLCIKHNDTAFVINYDSICAIATENWSSSPIPWDTWKHKTTQVGRYIRPRSSAMFVGPRAFVVPEEVPEESFHAPRIRSFDFTPDARRFTKPLDSLGVVTRFATCRAQLPVPGGLSGRHHARWAVSEDNILLIGAPNPDSPPDFRILMWTF